MWQQRSIEEATRTELGSVSGGSEELAWARYLHTRDDVVDNVLPYIASREPELTEHGVRHIGNVMDNVGRILGVDASGRDDQNVPFRRIDAASKLLLLMGALLHDVGNILGREGHADAVASVWRESGGGSFSRWKATDRRTILALCRAHTGKGADGSDDTLSQLSTSRFYFMDTPIELAQLAATLRFADELAEGPQRTSRLLVARREYGASSIDYHRYALITEVQIDRAHGRIALTYDIDLSTFGTGDEADILGDLDRLLSLIFRRVVKLEYERVFARHYAPDWLTFTETSVTVQIHRDHRPVLELPNLVLNDFNLRSSDIGQLAGIQPAYVIADIVQTVREAGVNLNDQR